MKYFFLSSLIIVSMLVHSQELKRRTGQWTNLSFYPNSGRVTDVELDPNNGDRLYAAPDASGIWYTESLGQHWECITDNIPEVKDRNSDGDIMVDPADFNTVYYVSSSGAYYITKDRGKDWTRVLDKEGKPVMLTDFKRNKVARLANGSLLMVATSIGNLHTKKSAAWPRGLHVSKDGGVTFKTYPDPSKDEQFLEIAIHPTNPNIIYAPTTHRLFKSTDAGDTFNPVYDFPGPVGGNSNIYVSPLEPDKVWLVTANRSMNEKDTAQTAIYLSHDTGKTWEVIQDMKNGIGSKLSIYDKGFPGSWLNNFAVNPVNTNEMVTGLDRAMESFDGGKSWQTISWWTRRKARLADGNIVPSIVSKHSADNHSIKFHPLYKSRCFRACDGGLFVRDPENGYPDWTCIGGDMSAMLIYSVKVNEFGERYILGNSQDIDIQTFYEGSWRVDRGYEGDAVTLNPYTGIANYPYCDCEPLGTVPGVFKSMNSWGRPVVCPNYLNPDEVYMLSDFEVVKEKTEADGKKIKAIKLKSAFRSVDRGRTGNLLNIKYSKPFNSIYVSRTEEQRVTVIGKDSLFTSSNHGIDWKGIALPKNDINTGAVDPVHPNTVWIGSSKGKVFVTRDLGAKWDTISTGLPVAGIEKMLFHEGTNGDLYALVLNEGIYYFDGSGKDKTWKRWMTGFNLTTFSDVTMDYPSQKLLASSYGRGIWQSDLEHPTDRFNGKTFTIKQMNQIGSRSVFTINTNLHLPEYYDIKWSVGKSQRFANSWKFYADSLKTGDTVFCSLAMKGSSDIKFKLKPFVVAKLLLSTVVNKAITKPSKNGFQMDSTYVNLGWHDFFNKDQSFTITMSVKPQSNGVLFANRSWYDHDAKGLLLAIDSGRLVLKTAALYNVSNSLSGSDNHVVNTERFSLKIRPEIIHEVTLVCRANEWFKIYLDGSEYATIPVPDAEKDRSLTSLMDLNLMADGFGERYLKGTLSFVKIWNKALSEKEIQKPTSIALDKNLVFYCPFDGIKSTKDVVTGSEFQFLKAKSYAVERTKRGTKKAIEREEHEDEDEDM